MIRNLTEAHVQDADPAEIRAMFAKGGPHWISESDIAVAFEVFMSIVQLTPEQREPLFRYIRSGELFCEECGKTSCLHGYSDD